VLIAGVSTRAAAESAAAAGFAVTAIDGFGDLDQHPTVRVISLGADFTPRRAARAAASIECDAAVYLASFENHPGAIDALDAHCVLWGNSAEVVRRVRDPLILADVLRRRGFAVPDVRLADDAEGQAVPADVDGQRWLVKPIASGGGTRIHPWRHSAPPPGRYYRQEFIDGPAGSVAFVAAGNRAIPLGISRQIVGDDLFGATGYQYCGSILGSAGDPQFARDETLAAAADALAQAVCEEFGLVGLNGIDFIARDGVPHTIEVNPRWSASMELAERAYGVSILGVHAAACSRGALPDFDVATARRRAGAIGKAIVFARGDLVVGDTSAWRDTDAVRDIPHRGDRIIGGHPVCTVFAAAADAAACHDALAARAARVYSWLDAWYA
jgi:predicted ATP-grasp superfamily ATP-dependent carboligase